MWSSRLLAVWHILLSFCGASRLQNLLPQSQARDSLSIENTQSHILVLAPTRSMTHHFRESSFSSSLTWQSYFARSNDLNRGRGPTLRVPKKHQLCFKLCRRVLRQLLQMLILDVCQACLSTCALKWYFWVPKEAQRPFLFLNMLLWRISSITSGCLDRTELISVLAERANKEIYPDELPLSLLHRVGKSSCF